MQKIFTKKSGIKGKYANFEPHSKSMATCRFPKAGNSGDHDIKPQAGKGSH